MTDQTPHRVSARTGSAGRFWFLFVASLAFALLAVLALCDQPGPAVAGPLLQSPAFPPSAQNGQPLFQENCAPCHGAAGWGDGPTVAELPQGATALADPAIARLATPAQWFEIVKEGRMMQFMPPWKSRLSDDQIWDVVATSLFLHTSQAELAQGAAVWDQQCAACHGLDGAGAGPRAVADGLIMPDLTDPSVTVSRSLADWHTVTSAGRGAMPAFAATLSDAQIWAVAQHARSFTFQPVVAAVVPPGTGRLTGQVINGTTGQPVAATVILNTFDNFIPLQIQEAQTSPDGAFAFVDLPTGSQYVFLLTSVYGDSTFGSEIASFPIGEDALNLPLTVYETSATPGEIRVDLAQWFVDSHQGALLVGELYRIVHDSATVYLGSEEVAPGRNAVLRFDLPAEAMSVVLDGGEIGGRFILTEDGVVDTQPLLPGSSQVLMRYLLPYNGSSAELAHSVLYPVDRLNVLVVDGPEVSTSLQSLGPQTVAEQQWNSFEGMNLLAGQTVSLGLTGLAEAQNPVVAPPATSDAVVANNPALLFAIGAAALAAILGVFVIYVLRRPTGQESAEKPLAVPVAPTGDADLAAERQRLLASIAQLDDLYAAGAMDDESYQRARAAQKRSLLLVGTRSETRLRTEAETGLSTATGSETGLGVGDDRGQSEQ